MKIRITKKIIKEANELIKRGNSSVKCCPTALTLRPKYGSKVGVGFTKIWISESHKVLATTSPKLEEQIRNWMWDKSFKPGWYEIYENDNQASNK